MNEQDKQDLAIGRAIRRLESLHDDNEYTKWWLEGTFFHGMHVIISAPDESQQRVPCRDAKRFINGLDELPEAVENAIADHLLRLPAQEKEM